MKESYTAAGASSSPRMHYLNGFEKWSSPHNNRQLIVSIGHRKLTVLIGHSKQLVDDFVGELTF